MPMIPVEIQGHAAGVATSVLWVFTALLFAAGGRRVGVGTVNTLRLVLAVLFHGVAHRVLFGTWVPSVPGDQLALLALSGVVGLSIGDQALFTAFVDIGPRLSLLIMTTSPLFAVVFGWVFLGESLELVTLVAISVTLGGIAWVVMERSSGGAASREHVRRGVLLALLGSACQAGGLLLSKQGMGHGGSGGEPIDPQAATLVRMFFASVTMIPLLALLRRGSGQRERAGRWSVGVLATVVGAALGPFLGVWMSLVAADRAPLGVAQTLCSLSPVFILPVAALMPGERVTLRSVVGAHVAVAGAALLFLAPARVVERGVEEPATVTP